MDGWRAGHGGRDAGCARRRPWFVGVVVVAVAVVGLPSTARAISEGPPGATSGDNASPLGGVEASADVNLFTGAAGTSIPITVPPGRNGMQPNLALTYSSQSGDGPWLGMGWDLSIGRIERSRRRGAPRYAEGDLDGDGLADGDEFVVILGGAQMELVPIEFNGDFATTFAARVDEGRAKVTRFGFQQMEWTLHDQSGRKYTFGQTSDSRIGPDNSKYWETFAWYLTKVEDLDGNHLEITYNQHGGVAYPEAIRYGGNTNSGPNGVLPHYYRIDFTWVDRAAYDARIPLSYANGFEQEFTRLLHRIDVLYTPAANGPVERIRTYELAWSTSTGTGRALLWSVQLYGYADGTGAPIPLRRLEGVAEVPAPWTFEYLDVDRPQWVEEPVAFPLNSFRNQNCDDKGWPCTKDRDFLDMNGDGLLDAVESTNRGDVPNGKWSVARNLGWDSSGSSPTLTFTPWQTWDPPIFGSMVDKLTLTDEIDQTEANGTTRATIDMNGDGRPDMIVTHPNVTPKRWDVYLNTPGLGHALPAEHWSLVAPGGHETQRWIQRRGNNARTQIDLIDINGDGLPDRVDAIGWEDTKQWKVWYNTGRGGDSAWRYHTFYSPVKRPRVGSTHTEVDLFDINGDGLPDLVIDEGLAQTDGDHVKHWDVYFGTGYGFVGKNGPVTEDEGTHVPIRWELDTPSPNCFVLGEPQGTFCYTLGLIREVAQGPFPYTHRYYKRDVLDVTGDGLPDLVVVSGGPTEPYGGTWSVAVNTGRGFADFVTWTVPQPLRRKGSSLDALTRDALDLDGNGYVDLVNTESNKVWFGYGNPGADAPPDALIAMRNPVGVRTTISYDVTTRLYERLGNALVYGPVDPALVPAPVPGTPYLPMPVWVVTALDRDNGAQTTTYTYRGGYYDPERRQFRGFHQVEAIDAYGVAERTFFHQTEALAGKRYRTLTYKTIPGSSATTKTLKEQQWTWAVEELNPGSDNRRLLPRVQETWRTDFSSATDVPWSPGGQTPRVSRTQFTYDLCGNITIEAVYDGDVSNLRKATFANYGPNTCPQATRVCSGVCNKPTSIAALGGSTAPGLQKTYEYATESHRRLKELTLEGAGDPTTKYFYDTYGNLTFVLDPRGRWTAYLYEAAPYMHATSVVADVAGAFETTEIDTHPYFGVPIGEEGPSGAYVQTRYDEFGRKVAEAEAPDTLNDPTRTFTYTWKASGGPTFQRIVRDEKEPAAGSGVRRQVTFLDLLGRPLQVQEQRRIDGNPQPVVLGAVRYEPGGRVDLEYAPKIVSLLSLTQFYDGFTATDPATLPTYDELGRVIDREAPDGSRTTTSYRQAWIVRTCDAAHAADPSTGACTEEARDALDRVVQTRTYLGTATTPETVHEITYSLAGPVLWERQNGVDATKIEYTYDDLGRVLTKLDPDAGTTGKGTWTYRYDPAGNVICEDDPLPGQHRWLVYDGLSRLVRREQRTGACPAPQVLENPAPVVRYAEYEYYDATGPPWSQGRLATRRTCHGPSWPCLATELAYEWRAEEYHPRGMVEVATETIGAPTGARSFRRAASYDTAGRLRTVTLPHTGGPEMVTYTYAAQGVLVSVVSDVAAYVNELQYDLLGRVTRVALANGLTDTYQYYEATGAAAGGAPVAGRGYQLQRIRTTDAGEQVRRSSVFAAYSPRGDITAVGDEHHPSNSTLHHTWVADYDDARRLTQWDAFLGGTVVSRTYDHDALGNLIAKDGKAYTPDAVHPHQITVIDGVPAIAYDANGQMTELPGDRHLRWDGDGRLVAVCRPVPCGQPGATVLAEYAYDPDGRRVWARAGSDATYYFDGFDLQMPVGGGVGSGTIFRHVRAGDRTIATHQEPEGNLLLAAAAPSAPPILFARIVTGSVVLLVVGLVGVGGPRTRAGRRLGVLRVGTTLVCFLLVQLPVPPGARACEHPTEPLEDTVFYHLDRLGSTELVTDHAGAVEEWLRHDPYGAVSAFQPNGTPKTAPGSTFQFTGQRGDDGTGLLYFGARFYEPALGLFVSPDPAGQFFSPYSYGGNPLAGTDPTGAFWEFLIIALLTAVATIVDALVQGASTGDAVAAGLFSFGMALAGVVAGRLVGASLATLGRS